MTHYLLKSTLIYLQSISGRSVIVWVAVTVFVKLVSRWSDALLWQQCERFRWSRRCWSLWVGSGSRVPAGRSRTRRSSSCTWPGFSSADGASATTAPSGSCGWGHKTQDFSRETTPVPSRWGAADSLFGFWAGNPLYPAEIIWNLSSKFKKKEIQPLMLLHTLCVTSHTVGYENDLKNSNSDLMRQFGAAKGMMLPTTSVFPQHPQTKQKIWRILLQISTE